MNTSDLIRTLTEKKTGRYAGIVVLRRPDDPEALIILRDGPPEAGKWACPGGGLEKGENAEEAAYRELEEETGVQASQMHLFDEAQVDIGHLSFFWTWVDDTEEACAGDDAARCRWVKVRELPKLAWDNADKIRQALQLAEKEKDPEEILAENRLVARVLGEAEVDSGEDMDDAQFDALVQDVIHRQMPNPNKPFSPENFKTRLHLEMLGFRTVYGGVEHLSQAGIAWALDTDYNGPGNRYWFLYSASPYFGLHKVARLVEHQNPLRRLIPEEYRQEPLPWTPEEARRLSYPALVASLCTLYSPRKVLAPLELPVTVMVTDPDQQEYPLEESEFNDEDDATWSRLAPFLSTAALNPEDLAALGFTLEPHAGWRRKYPGWGNWTLSGRLRLSSQPGEDEAYVYTGEGGQDMDYVSPDPLAILRTWAEANAGYALAIVQRGPHAYDLFAGDQAAEPDWEDAAAVAAYEEEPTPKIFVPARRPTTLQSVLGQPRS